MKDIINKLLLFLLIFLLGSVTGYLIFETQKENFEELAPEEMYQRIITGRNLAIDKAVESGIYRCCINPPCTMCYMEGNQWNNGKAGSCVCDELIAQGKEPCPQCKRGLCETDKEGTCKLNGSLK